MRSIFVFGVTFVATLFLLSRQRPARGIRQVDSDTEPPLYPREDRPFFVIDRAEDVDPRTRILQ